ncbi:MAG: universal stress protein [Acidimicrobiales bacterium]
MTNTVSPPSHQIVVGVDGSSSSLLALDWAIHQAELTDASLLVVMAWHWPMSAGWGLPSAPPSSPDTDAVSTLEEVLESARREHNDVIIESRVVEGHPSPVLIEASSGADLLVVGSRGRGEFAGMLLGSVSAHCVSQAACPVLVVRQGP